MKQTLETYNSDGTLDSTSEIPFSPQEILDIKESYYEKVLNGGIVVGGIAVKTHETSRGLINGAVSRALLENDAQKTHDFYAPDGSVIELTNSQFMAIGLAMADHVQKCLKAKEMTRNASYETVEAFSAAFNQFYAEA